jgi:hypothetical protein
MWVHCCVLTLEAHHRRTPEILPRRLVAFLGWRREIVLALESLETGHCVSISFPAVITKEIPAFGADGNWAKVRICHSGGIYMLVS